MKNVIGLLLLGLTVALARQVAAETVERIAFFHCDAACAVVVMDADGQNPLAVAEGVSPTWAPDGSRLAFAKVECFDPRRCQSHIAVVDLGTGTVADLTAASDEYDVSPAWSPDGSRIAFARYGPLKGIYVMNADGSSVERLTPDSGEYVDAPAWSPDGSKITFTCDVNLCQIDLDGTGPTVLTPGFDAAWSPDGATIAFGGYFYSVPFCDDWGNCYDFWYSDIAVMNADASDVSPLTFELDAGGPTWSPDGSRIAFWSGYGGIATVNADGAGLKWLSPVGYGPVWMPGTLTRATAPPVITHTPITSGTLGTAIAVTATITDDTDVTAPTLGYRVSGGTYTTVPLASSGETYTATIPGDAVTRAGVEYYLEARDADGNITRTPLASPFIPYRISVQAATLTVTRGGTGTGSVSSSPAGIACGSRCAAVFAGGTTVALTAVADTGSAFVGWSGGDCSDTAICSVTLSSDRTVTANFQALPRATLTVAKTGRSIDTSEIFTTRSRPCLAPSSQTGARSSASRRGRSCWCPPRRSRRRR